ITPGQRARGDRSRISRQNHGCTMNTTSFGEQRLARAYLVRVAEPPAPALTTFVAEHGPVDAAARVAAGRVPIAVDNETNARRHLVDGAADLVTAAEHGARLVIPEDAEWPAWPLLCLELAQGHGRSHLAAPLGLWVQGTLNLDDGTARALAIVG